MKKIGLGIIGLGYIGNTHLIHSLKLPNANLVAVSDISKRALSKAKSLGVKKTFTNYELLLKEPEVDAVIIALPTHLHADCARQSAEAKKHIFLEKPIATNLKEANEIVLASRRNSVKLMIGYPYRFEKEFIDLNGQLKSGVLGDVEIARATYISSGPFFHRTQDYSPAPVPQWWFNKELTGGGVLIDLGSHMINLLRWYFGEIVDIKSLLGYRFNLDLEDSAICLARFDSGTTAVITVGWFSQENKLNVEFLGTVKHTTGQKPLQNQILTAVQLLATRTTKFFHAHQAELQHFVACIGNDLLPSPSGDDGIRDLEAISAAYNNQIQMG